MPQPSQKQTPIPILTDSTARDQNVQLLIETIDNDPSFPVASLVSSLCQYPSETPEQEERRFMGTFFQIFGMAPRRFLSMSKTTYRKLRHPVFEPLDRVLVRNYVTKERVIAVLGYYLMTGRIDWTILDGKTLGQWFLHRTVQYYSQSILPSDAESDYSHFELNRFLLALTVKDVNLFVTTCMYYGLKPKKLSDRIKRQLIWEISDTPLPFVEHFGTINENYSQAKALEQIGEYLKPLNLKLGGARDKDNRALFKHPKWTKDDVASIFRVFSADKTLDLYKDCYRHRPIRCAVI